MPRCLFYFYFYFLSSERYKLLSLWSGVVYSGLQKDSLTYLWMHQTDRQSWTVTRVILFIMRSLVRRHSPTQQTSWMDVSSNPQQQPHARVFLRPCQHHHFQQNGTGWVLGCQDATLTSHVSECHSNYRPFPHSVRSTVSNAVAKDRQYVDHLHLTILAVLLTRYSHREAHNAMVSSKSTCSHYSCKSRPVLFLTAFFCSHPMPSCFSYPNIFTLLDLHRLPISI